MIRSQHENRKPFAPNSLKIPTRQHRCNKAAVWPWCVPNASPRRKISETCPFWNHPHCSPSADMGESLAGIGLVLVGGVRQAQRVDQFRVRRELIGARTVGPMVCLDNLANRHAGL